MPKTKPLPEYPEHEKLKAKQKEVAVLSDFYDFITQEKGWAIAQWIDTANRYWPVQSRPDEIIGMFLGIDPKKLETEKRAMLEEIRKANALEDVDVQR
jgi:hypothetical protein